MTTFETKQLPVEPDATAPDGSDVRVLLRLKAGSSAHFTLAAGQTSIAVVHGTVEEIWYCLSGHGEMWRQRNQIEEIVTIKPGVCLTIPLGTQFQFRALGEQPLEIFGVTMPPWPDNDDEAVVVDGKWQSSDC